MTKMSNMEKIAKNYKNCVTAYIEKMSKEVQKWTKIPKVAYFVKRQNQNFAKLQNFKMSVLKQHSIDLIFPFYKGGLFFSTNLWGYIIPPKPKIFLN